MFARYHEPTAPTKSTLRFPKRVGTIRQQPADTRLLQAGKLKLNEAYMDFNPGTDLKLALRAFLPLLLPTLLLIHLPFLALQYVSASITGEWVALPTLQPFLVGGYLLGILFGYRRYREYKAYVTVHRLSWRFNINRLYESFEAAYGHSTDKDVQRELKRLGRIREESLRALLFPTALELAMLEKICDSEANSASESVRNTAQFRRTRLSFENRMLEHEAAKRLADTHSAGGVNTYDALVAKHGRNIAPSMRGLIGQGD